MAVPNPTVAFTTAGKPYAVIRSGTVDPSQAVKEVSHTPARILLPLVAEVI